MTSVTSKRLLLLTSLLRNRIRRSQQKHSIVRHTIKIDKTMGNKEERQNGCSQWIDPLRKSVTNRWDAVRNGFSKRRSDQSEEPSTSLGRKWHMIGLFGKIGAHRNKKGNKSKGAKVEVCVADVYHTEIADEYVPVNILHDDVLSDGTKKIEIRSTTPENYSMTYDYFESINTNRQHLFKAIYILGDRLLMGVLDGEKQEWKDYVHKSEEEVRAWKQKCRTSDQLFRDTGRILGQEEAVQAQLAVPVHHKVARYLREHARPLRYRIARYIRTQVANVFGVTAARRTTFCPCFGE